MSWFFKGAWTTTAQPSTIPPGPDAASLSGWLVKEGSFIRSWKRRWFKLDPKTNSLSYAEGPDAVPIKIINLADISEIISSKQVCDERDIDHCFALKQTNGRFLYLQGDNGEDVRKWSTAIHLALQHVRAHIKAQSTPPAAAEAEASPASSSQPKLNASLTPILEPLTADMSRISCSFHSHTQDYMAMRQKAPTDAKDRVERLKMRVYRYATRSRKGMSADAFDESIVPWSRSMTNCKICQGSVSSKFSLSFKGKMFCRLCGDAVCGKDTCATAYKVVDVAKLLDVMDRQPTPEAQAAVLLVCAQCKEDIDLACRSVSTPLTQYYAQVTDLKKRITRLINELQPKTDAILGGQTAYSLWTEADKIRQQILKLLQEIERIAAIIRQESTNDPSRKQLHTNVSTSLSMWVKKLKVSVSSVMNAAQEIAA